MNVYHTLTAKETEKQLNTNLKQGLTEQEAAARLKTNGPNVLREKKNKGFFTKFVSQFNDFMIIILLVAAAISFVTGAMDGDSDLAEPIIILVIVILNAILGVVQENKAEKSLEALKRISSPHARVIRGGAELEIAACDVVPGDLLVLSGGDIAAADCRLVNGINLQVDESSLTGESVPVMKNAQAVLDKNAPLGDRVNLVMSSTSVTAGKGLGIVTKTGMNTEVGHIAGLILSSENPETPLQKKLAKVGKGLGIAALAICGVIFILGLVQHLPPFDMFVTAISLAVAAIPEGLPAIVTIMLAIGVQRMAKRGAIIRNLPSVETLGGATVICSDKTGTLTQNKMEVTDCWGEDPLLTFRLASLCSENNSKNPTELAILAAARKEGLQKEVLDQKYTLIEEIPFNSNRKRMTTLHRYLSGNRVITKGAIDLILPLCTHFWNGQKLEPLTARKTRDILAENERMTQRALRVICVAYGDVSRDTKTIQEKNLVFTGLIGMADPPRPDAVRAVSLCKKAGIRPVMITGDHLGTACAVAKEMDILTEGTKAVTGTELEKMPQEELEQRIDEFSVFARVTPEHKVRIVKAWQARNQVVAMTGDGVNDAPALKAADIGCSLGIAGTDVAKASSDMVLTDDNFATIVEAVREGRGIFANIRKAVKFLLSSNIGEIITVFIGLLMGWPPLLAIQLLWVNLVTDSLPAIALGVDPSDDSIMEEKPHQGGLFAGGMVGSIILEGCMIGGLALLAFSIGFNVFGDLTLGRTMAFAVLSMSQLVHAFNMRSEHSVLKAGLFKNPYLVLSFLAGVVLQAGVISIPALATLFKVVFLSASQWGIVGILSLLPLMIVELQKLVSGIWDKKFSKEG